MNDFTRTSASIPQQESGKLVSSTNFNAVAAQVSAQSRSLGTVSSVAGHRNFGHLITLATIVGDSTQGGVYTAKRCWVKDLPTIIDADPVSGIFDSADDSDCLLINPIESGGSTHDLDADSMVAVYFTGFVYDGRDVGIIVSTAGGGGLQDVRLNDLVFEKKENGAWTPWHTGTTCQTTPASAGELMAYMDI